MAAFTLEKAFSLDSNRIWTFLGKDVGCVTVCVQGFAPHCACTFRACCVWLMNE